MRWTFETQRHVPLKFAGFGKRAACRLYRHASLYTVGDVLEARDADFYAVPRMGPARLAEIRRLARAYLDRDPGGRVVPDPVPADPSVLDRPILPLLREAADALGPVVGPVARAIYRLDVDDLLPGDTGMARRLGLTRDVYRRARRKAENRFGDLPVPLALGRRMREVARAVHEGWASCTDDPRDGTPDGMIVDALMREPWAAGLSRACLETLYEELRGIGYVYRPAGPT